MNTFAKIYIVLWVALIVVEIVAATTSYVTVDTMSEFYWTAQAKYPVLMRIALTAGMVALWVHLVNKGAVE
jgi:spore maturation protein SpmA